jgi:hypothetical protein
MVIRRAQRTDGGWLSIELAVAIMILGLALIPLAFSFRGEEKLLRAHYNQAVAMEIVDGEMEILRAGRWREILAGEQAYAVKAASATNLPAGKFVTLRDPARLRLEWRPEKTGRGGLVFREMPLPR